MRIVPAKWIEHVPAEVRRWTLFSALLHAMSRLLYPVAIVLLSEARVGLALTSLLAPLALSLLRALSTNIAAGRLRRDLFRRVGRVLEVLPSALPTCAPGIEQLEVRIARALPWLESRAVDSLPNLAGSLLALPRLAGLALRDLGVRACLTVGVPMLVALLASRLFARRAARHYDAACAAFDDIAVLLERGLHARVELRVHGLSSAHQSTLQERGTVWDQRERRARLAFALTGWGVPVAVIVLSVVTAQLVGIEAIGWALRFVARPEAADVRASMYLLVALPLILGITRNLSEFTAEQPHLDALSAFYKLASPRGEPAQDVAGEVGDLVFDAAEFQFGLNGAANPVTVRASFVWRNGE
jgi:ABC-type multidrug transport system fused ATPase/permease subunit